MLGLVVSISRADDGVGSRSNSATDLPSVDLHVRRSWPIVTRYEGNVVHRATCRAATYRPVCRYIRVSRPGVTPVRGVLALWVVFGRVAREALPCGLPAH